MGMRFVDRGDTSKTNYFSDEDNDKCVELLRIWRPIRLKDLEGSSKGETIPMSVPAPEFVCKCIMTICEQTSRRYNYVDYTYRDEMVSSAILNAVRYLHTFDPDKVGERSGRINFHAWVTRTLDRVFGGVIKNEKKNEYRKNAALVYDPNLANSLFDEEGIEGNDGDLTSRLFNQEIYSDFIARAAKYEENEENERQRQREKDAAKKPVKGGEAPNALF